MQELLKEITIEDYLNNPDFCSRIVNQIYQLEAIRQLRGYEMESDKADIREFIRVLRAMQTAKEQRLESKIFKFLTAKI